MKDSFKPLTKAEEQIMQIVWKLGKAFVKDIIDELPEPKPHYNTVSTVIKILAEKGFVGYESFGKSNRYFSLVGKDDYSKRSMKQFVKKYFEGSFTGMLSFFAKEKDISISELEKLLEELRKDDKISSKKPSPKK